MYRIGDGSLDVLGRIQQLMKEREWSTYKRAQESGIPIATMPNMFRRKATPTIPTLEAICSSFGISLSQFFEIGTNETVAHLTPEQKRFFDRWTSLTVEQKELLCQLVDNMK